MSEFESWQITPAVAAGLERLGWAPAQVAGEMMQPLVRGTNVVAVMPPVPVWATPAAAALLSGLELRGGRALILTAPALVSEWGAGLAALTTGTPLRIEAARGPARAARRIKADAVDVLVASPDTALTLLTRSSLAPEQFTAIVFAWPEDWAADEAIAVLLQDLPRDAQRVVLTAKPDAADGLVERYARRALLFGVPSSDPAASPTPTPVPLPSVRTLATSWSGRAAAVADLIEATDPTDATIWTADRRDHEILRAALGGGVDGVRIATQGAEPSGSVICYDLPNSTALASLANASDVTLLVPPGTETHVARIATQRRPVQVASSSTALLARDSGYRSEIVAELGRDTADAAFYALAPLFERHEPQRIAAALFALWRRAVTPVDRTGSAAVDSPTPVGGVSATKVWVGVGKKDEATVGDLVAVIVKEIGVDRTLIGRIELRDTFALVEVPEAEAERIARRLTGLTIRRRKLVAHVDRGPGEARGMGGPRGGGGRGVPRSGGARDDRR